MFEGKWVLCMVGGFDCTFRLLFLLVRMFDVYADERLRYQGNLCQTQFFLSKFSVVEARPPFYISSWYSQEILLNK